MNQITTYLDNSSTTFLTEEVSSAMGDFRKISFGNPRSVHRLGQYAKSIIEESREKFAKGINCEPKEFIFTSGGTESNNFALKGYLFKKYFNENKIPEIITTKTEHHAVLHTLEFLKKFGAKVIFIEVDKFGLVQEDVLDEALKGCNKEIAPIVSIMHANNETGNINNIQNLSKIVHAHRAYLHTDAVQTFGKLNIDVKEFGADVISFSSHKIHGPKGIGGIYLSKELELEPIIHGGSQERQRRGGTESTELIVGFDKAFELANSNIDSSLIHFKKLNGILKKGLSSIDNIKFVSDEENSLMNIINVTFFDSDKLDGEGLIVGMDLEGVAVSNGSACTSGSMQPSHVLLAMGFPENQAKCAVRFSMSRFTSIEDVNICVEALKKVLKIQRNY